MSCTENTEQRGTRADAAASENWSSQPTSRSKEAPPTKAAPRGPTIEPAGLHERVRAASLLLEQMHLDRGLLTYLSKDERRRLLTAAGRISRPDADAKRRQHKEARKRRRQARRAEDQAVLNQTGIRLKRAKLVFETPKLVAPPLLTYKELSSRIELIQPAKCYVCKGLFSQVHHFYDQMCATCAQLNLEKRHQSADLTGRVAFVTGARVKIGYQAAIKLLRAGAHVIVSTRFPRDAAVRYAAEADFADWKGRLDIYGLDLRHTPSVESLMQRLANSYSRLDFILNNACQTVRRPAGFYSHMIEAELKLQRSLPASAKPLVARYEALRQEAVLEPQVEPSALVERHQYVSDVGMVHAAAMSQLVLLNDDAEDGHALFPLGQLDADLQQVDLRKRNSWRLALAEVSAVEFLEVQLVNNVSPFIINSRLKPLMLRETSRDKHIVNVSAVEGQFYRNHKTDRHPHTNMAKAALNMMTRTSAADYVRDGIHMNSVDTGWVTDEDPAEVAARKRVEHDFHPPLDIVDGAARICDPIFSGMLTGKHVWGQFLKDYRSVDW